MTPRAVRIAGGIAGLEGAAAVVVAVVLIVRQAAGHHEDAISGYGTAAWFAIMGSVVAAAGWALWTGRRWGRGIAVFANLLLLGVAWYVFTSGQLRYAVGVAAVSVAALGLLFSPSTLHWVARAGDQR
ncbi:hypothetical protein JDV09_20040 [Mycobacterium sp. Y57]|uniref:hypothetical protein n=1 Tax=Mycolicibacterium xanthum TaxID=2796469 RepID=UPI001C84448A|nr:hypothetical protein [Mycolicibacterium xanthum]MBX7434369.1 hypothetical protein [Mycolicibacterium xanthum]